SSGPAVALLFAGTNDLAQSGETATDVWSNAVSEIQVLKQAGCRVFVGTMISRNATNATGNTADADKNAYNALMLSQAKTAGAEGVIDFAANPLLGADGAN